MLVFENNCDSPRQQSRRSDAVETFFTPECGRGSVRVTKHDL